MSDWLVTTNAFACLVCTDAQGIIRDTAPLLRRFRGQPFPNLGRWMQRQFGAYTKEPIPPWEPTPCNS